MKTVCKPFDELSVFELYEILKLRSAVFVVEQKCIFLDMDDNDQQSMHFCMYMDDQLAGYARILPPRKVYEESSIGRVATHSRLRKQSLGKELMKNAINECRKIYPESQIKIAAQLYLKHFYESFGFVQTGDVYDEDGIPHIEMLLPHKKA